MADELEKDDLRTDLEAAFEQHSEEGGSAKDTEEPLRTTEQETEAPAPAPAVEAEVGEPGEQSKDGRVRGADGKFAKQLKEPVERTGEKPVEAKPAAGEAKPAAVKPDTSVFAAPVSWKAGAKSEWAKIPKVAQEEIMRRETETSKVLSQTANARKHFDEFNNTIGPFMPLIRAQNSTPMVAVKNLMTTAAGLTIGSPQQKAQIVAEMIGNFGVDIQTLDSILSGQVQQGPRSAAVGTSQVEVAVQRQLGPVYDFMNKMQQTQAQREAQMRQEADTVVEQFSSKHEFFEELRDDIADLMEVAANRGRNVTLEQAYNSVVSSHPEYSAAVQQRAAANRAKQNGSVQRARNAASSVVGTPNMGSPGKTGEKSRRDDILEAWEGQNDR
jgi:hypothetical protein